MLARFSTNWTLNIADGNIKQYNHFEIVLKIKNKNMSPRNLTLKCLPKTNGEKYIYGNDSNVHINIIHNSSKWKQFPLTGE